MNGFSDGYPIPAQRCRVEDIVRRSRFITTVDHAPNPEAAAALVAEVRREFGDATHNCWAYAAGAPGATAQVGMSDDGEPSGTAGRPLLTVLLHSGVGELAAVVTRYFGGTKLGTGGLARAYSQALQHALAELPLSQRIEQRRLTITLSYADLGDAQRLLADCHGNVVTSDYRADVQLTAALPSAELDRFRQRLNAATRGRARVRPLPAAVNSSSGADRVDV